MNSVNRSIASKTYYATIRDLNRFSTEEGTLYSLGYASVGAQETERG